MRVIGFTEVYYTLWVTYPPIKEFINDREYRESQTFTYVQNLSKDLTKAQEKVKNSPYLNAGEDVTIDLGLRGHSSFTNYGDIITELNWYEFSFGKLRFQDIRTSDDIWQLKRATEQEDTEIRQALALNRLIDLGEFVDYNGEIISKYTLKCRLEKIEEAKDCDHFYADGEKINVTVILEKQFTFSTYFNYNEVVNTVMVFRTEDGKILKYVGSTPPSHCKENGYYLDLNQENLHLTLKATVKHTEYKGQKETRLQRIKILSYEIK